MFHFVDFVDDGLLSGDEAWERLNRPGFVYGGGGRFMRDPGSARFTDALPGFVSRYAMSAVEEDKAEVFSFLMTAPRKAECVARGDTTLDAKLAAVRRQIARVCPAMPGHCPPEWHSEAPLHDAPSRCFVLQTVHPTRGPGRSVGVEAR